MEYSCAKSFHRFDLESLIRQFITVLKVLGLKISTKRHYNHKGLLKGMLIINIM